MDSLETLVRNAQNRLTELEADESRALERLAELQRQFEAEQRKITEVREKIREEQKRVADFLQMLPLFAGGIGANPGSFGAAPSRDSLPQSTARDLLTSTLPPKPQGGLLVSPSRHTFTRAPRGTWPKILDATLDILKTEGRPMRTRELITELLKRGFTFEMSSPVTSLSNKLANSLAFRSNRESGWHLAEWPDMADSMSLDDIRRVLSPAPDSTNGAETPTKQRSGPERVIGMSSHMAATEVLRDCRRPMTVYEIAEELEKRGYPFVSDDHPAAVSTGLTRRLRTRKDVRRESPGKWVLSEWYTAEEIAEMDARMGGKDGHNIFGNSEKTRQALLKAQANGVRLGRPSKISDREKENARKLIESGVNPRVIADSLQVKRKTVMRWIEGWSKETATKPSDFRMEL